MSGSSAIISLSNHILGRRAALPSDSSLNSTQQSLDRIQGNIQSAASDYKLLASLALGSAAYELGRMSALRGLGHSAFLQAASPWIARGLGLSAEALAFQSSQAYFQGQSLAQALDGGKIAHTVFDFGLLRGAHFLGRQHPWILAHSVQSAGLAFTHSLRSDGPSANFSWIEALAEAESLNIALQGGQALSRQALRISGASIASMALESEARQRTVRISPMQGMVPIPWSMASERDRPPIPLWPRVAAPILSSPSEPTPDIFTVDTAGGIPVRAQVYEYPGGRIEVAAPPSNPEGSVVTLRMVREDAPHPDHAHLAPGERLQLPAGRRYYLRSPGQRAEGDHLQNFRFVADLRGGRDGPLSGTAAVGDLAGLGIPKQIQGVDCYIGVDHAQRRFLAVSSQGEIAVREVRGTATAYASMGKPVHLETGRSYEVRTPQGWKKLGELFEAL